MNQEYCFQYNVAADNDTLNRPDLFLEIKAEVMPMCTGVNPLVSITFLEMHSSYMRRIKNLNLVVRECEIIAMDHFATGNQDQFNTIEPVDQLPTAVQIAEEAYASEKKSIYQ